VSTHYTVHYYATHDTLNTLQYQEQRSWDVCLTTYEMAKKELGALSKIGIYFNVEISVRARV
jgi:hypothetical protein